MEAECFPTINIKIFKIVKLQIFQTIKDFWQNQLTRISSVSQNKFWNLTCFDLSKGFKKYWADNIRPYDFHLFINLTGRRE